MQLLNCPWCGPRAHIEFTYIRDQQSVSTRGDGNDANIQHELERIYLRSNHPGAHQEIWQHSAGCRGWLRITRNNLTHEVEDCLPCQARAAE